MEDCSFKFLRLTFFLIIANINCVVLGQENYRCNEQFSVTKCFYFSNKKATKKQAYETCQNFSNSSLYFESNLRDLNINDDKLWTHYSIESQENRFPEDVQCILQTNPLEIFPEKLLCTGKNESKLIRVQNKYFGNNDCIAFNFKKQKFYFVPCSEKLHFICIRPGEKSVARTERAANTMDSPDNIIALRKNGSLKYYDKSSYENLILDACTKIDVSVFNSLGIYIHLTAVNGPTYRISEDLEWSLVKNMNINVSCSTNTSTIIYSIVPVHSFEFLVKSNLSFDSISFNSGSISEKGSIEKVIRKLTGEKNFELVFQFQQDSNSWKITLKYLNETELIMASRLILEKLGYTPLFCVQQIEVSYSDICRTRQDILNNGTCKVSKNQDGLLSYKWFAYNAQKCCPPDYEAINGSKCVKISPQNKFATYFSNLIGIEDSIVDVLEQGKNTESILKYIRLKELPEVWRPMLKLKEFDRILHISRSDIGESYREQYFETIETYFSYNIDTKETQFHESLDKNIPYVSVINIEELLIKYKSTSSFLKNNPMLTDVKFCNGYFSHYDGKCLKTWKSSVFLSYKEANEFCKNESLELLTIEDDFMEHSYRKMFAKENTVSAWMGLPSESLKKATILTPSGRHVLKSNAKLREIVCQTKPRSSSILLTMNLTEQVNDRGPYLCLNFSDKNVYFLRNFPTCYCYPDWRMQPPVKSYSNICDYNIGVKYSSKCQCAAVILHKKVQSIIFSNIKNFYNRSLNYFNVSITFKGNNLQIEHIKNALKSMNNSILISKWDDDICENSNLHLDYSKRNNNFSSYISSLACPENILSEDINVKETEILLSQIVKNMNVSVIVRATDGCHKTIFNASLTNFTWEKTDREGEFQPVELCLTQKNVPAYRKCEKHNYFGYKWKDFSEKCKEIVTHFERNLYKLLKAQNISNKISELQERLSKNVNKITPFAIYAASKILSETDRKSNYSAIKVINIVNSILESPVLQSDVSDLNVHSNVSNKILESFDELLISQIPFNYTTEQEDANNNYNQIVVFSGSISEMDKFPIAIGIENENSNKYDLKYLETLRDENKSLNVIVSIPESLRQNNLKLDYVYKQWKNKLLFDDPTLKGKKLEVVGDIIDVIFKNIKSNITFGNFEDNITIKMKVDPMYQNKSYKYICASRNLKNGSWSTEGCFKNSTESYNNYVACTCNHMTHYGFLFHVEIYNENPLNIIANLGSLISIFLMFIVIISSFLLKQWPKQEDFEGKTLINLCVAISGATISMLIGSSQKSNSVFCGIFATTLHYFLLCSFFWMSIEALLKYLIYVKERLIIEHKFLKHSFLVSWGIPLVICIPLLTYRLLNDQHSRSCWLQKTDMYYYFLIPLTLFMTHNLFIYFSIIHKLRIMLANEFFGNESKKIRLKRVIREVVALGFVFGLTWVFGFLLLTGDKTFTTIIAYIFGILQSLQGALIFVRVCLNGRFRNEWLRLLNRLT